MPAAEPVARPLVLVVDDANALRQVMSRALLGAGFAVLTAPDAHSAIALIEALRTPPELVITDLRMPRMSGMELAAWITDHYPDLPVLFVSGFSLDYPDLPGHLLTKPFTPTDLLAAVRAILESPRPIVS